MLGGWMMAAAILLILGAFWFYLESRWPLKIRK
jgi:hypothetical protein